MKTTASIILAGAVAVFGTLAARGVEPAGASAELDGIAAAAEANGDVTSAAVRAVMAHLRAEARVPAPADVAFNPDRREYLSVSPAAGQVRGRRYDLRGMPISASFAIAAAAPEPAIAPRVAYDPRAQRYLVVWARQGGSVEAIRLDAAGAAAGGVFPVSPAGAWR